MVTSANEFVEVHLTSCIDLLVAAKCDGLTLVTVLLGLQHVSEYLKPLLKDILDLNINWLTDQLFDLSEIKQPSCMVWSIDDLHNPHRDYLDRHPVKVAEVGTVNPLSLAEELGQLTDEPKDGHSELFVSLRFI